jgi:hypothetical protein
MTDHSCLGASNGEGGIRTRGTGCYPYDGLANRYLQPLGHLSGCGSASSAIACNYSSRLRRDESESAG